MLDKHAVETGYRYVPPGHLTKDEVDIIRNQIYVVEQVLFHEAWKAYGRRYGSGRTRGVKALPTAQHEALEAFLRQLREREGGSGESSG